jgi:NADPH:quinone reductase-like Zn-dependent oxidoreductase
VLVNYREEDFVERVRAATEGDGADVVLDIMGASYLERNVDVLATGGRLLVIGLQGGRRGEIDLAAMLAKRASLHVMALRSRPLAEKATIVEAVRRHVWPLIEQGRVQPVVDRSFPMQAAADAHRTLESSEHIGKILLTT